MTRSVLAIAGADFRERTRRYSFLVTLAATAWLGWLVLTGRITLTLGSYRGIMNAAWAGTLTALTTTTFVTLVGFWVVKNAVERDRRTGVGQILAATTLRSRDYLLGKFLSNVAVLGVIVAAMAGVAATLPLVRGEGGSYDPIALLAPFVWIAIPAIVFAAALAVVFETVPLLAGGLGNVLWFFLWSAAIAVPMSADLPWADFTGILTVQHDAARVVSARFADYKGGFALQAGAREEDIKGKFEWNGVAWTAGEIGMRVAWLGVAALLVAGSTAWFDRFDESGRRSRRRREATRGEPVPATGPDTRGTATTHLTPLPPGATQAPRALALVAGELTLLLRGRGLGWYAVALGLLVAQLAMPLDTARAHVLPFAWIWPVLIWSSLGSREARFGTEEFLFSSQRPLAVQIPAQYLAGVIVALGAGCGVGFRLAATGRWDALLGWSAGALLIPAAALALGAWSGSGKPFETLYTALWYVGPLQPTPGIDFMCVTDAAIRAGTPLRCVVAAVALVAAAVAGRSRRLRR